jgi:hypothetical protein
MKLKAQGSKLKRSSKVQAPIESGSRCGTLEFEVWIFGFLLSFEL